VTTVANVAAPSWLRVFLAAVRSEWLKLRTVRSTIWALLMTLVLTVGLGALFSAARVSRWDRLDPRERLIFDPAGFSLNGLFLAQLAIGVLGVLVMSSEYATGQIRATFGATPRRRTVLAAKVVVFAVVVLIVGLVACFAAFTVGQAIFSTKHAEAALGDTGVLRAVIGGAVYLSLLGAIAIGLGAILRRTAGAIATLVGFLLILPILVSFLPNPWNDDIGKYLPSEAGAAIFHVRPRGVTLSPGGGLAMLFVYAAASLLIGAVLLTARDA
jgi:ABC-2 type transport system permease protein